MDERMRI